MDSSVFNTYFQPGVKYSGYSNQEMAGIYELARFCLENGDIHKAEIILFGLVNVAPKFVPALLGLTYVYLQNGKYDHALKASQMAYNLMPESMEAILFYVSCLITKDDFNTAGTILGEVADNIQNGVNLSPNIKRFYYMQLARFQSHT